MLRYLYSIEFFLTLIVFIFLMRTFDLGDLANYIQVSQIFAWSYIIYHLRKHHKLMEELLEDDEDTEK